MSVLTGHPTPDADSADGLFTEQGAASLAQPSPRRYIPLFQRRDHWKAVRWAWEFAAIVTAVALAAVIGSVAAYIVWTVVMWFRHSG